MNKLPISLFAYNFPHKKTQDFIFRILAEGYNISVIYAADPIQLGIPKSCIKSKIDHLGLIHPQKIASNFGIRYEVLSHDSQNLVQDALENPTLAVISGARILKKEVINAFPHGIINFHPGIIPYARGLDALLWSIFHDHPLGVTAHLINEKIDAGIILMTSQIKVFKSDTILDLSERLYDMQLDMLNSAISNALLKKGDVLNDYGSYNKKMDCDLEKITLDKISNYVEKRSVK